MTNTKLERSEIVMYISKETCDECKEIIAKLKKYTGIDVVVYYEGKRQFLKPPSQMPRPKPYKECVLDIEEEEITVAQNSVNNAQSIHVSEKDGTVKVY